MLRRHRKAVQAGISAVIPSPRLDSAHLVKDLPASADGVAAGLVAAAERGMDVAGGPLEGAVDLDAAGSFDKRPDVCRPDAAGGQDGDAAAGGVDQAGEKFGCVAWASVEA